MLEYYFNKISTPLDLSKFENKTKVRNQMFVMIDLVRNQTEQGYWLKKLSEELGFAEDDVRGEFKVWQSRQKNDSQRLVDMPAVKTSYRSREERLSELLLSFSD